MSLIIIRVYQSRVLCVYLAIRGKNMDITGHY